MIHVTYHDSRRPLFSRSILRTSILGILDDRLYFVHDAITLSSILPSLVTNHTLLVGTPVVCPRTSEDTSMTPPHNRSSHVLPSSPLPPSTSPSNSGTLSRSFRRKSLWSGDRNTEIVIHSEENTLRDLSVSIVNRRSLSRLTTLPLENENPVLRQNNDRTSVSG